MSRSGKGSAFEREISKSLSKWLTNGERDDIFWRSSQSGGRATTRAKVGKTTSGSYGDITALHLIGEPFISLFCVELKRGYSKDTDILDLLDSKKSVPKLLDFWNQCERDKKLGKKAYSLVIFKRDRKDICIMFDFETYRALSEWNGHPKCRSVVFSEGRFRLRILRYEDFLNWIDPKIIEPLYQARFPQLIKRK